MKSDTKKIAKTHDDVLEGIAVALDIPPSKYEEAIKHYESIGAWLDRDNSSIAKYDPEISPQGSFLLGTVTRPLTDTEEYDVDLVCLIGGTKQDFTQKTLKEAVGKEVTSYAKAHGLENPPEEQRRCWTLHYADGAQFHMDIVPALPDAQRYQVMLNEHGHSDLAGNSTLTGQAIAITDKTLPQYTVLTDDWPQSNPMGYAAWFRSRMTIQLTERKMAFVNQMITASVDDIPDYKVKTPLQRTIQLLKRHRDCMFPEDDEHKPISIIITTLAAHAYNEESTISAALRSILAGMEKYIEYRGGKAWISNPVNPAENFADKWAEESKKQESFYTWLKQVREDFALYLRNSPYETVPAVLKENLGATLVDRTLKAILPVLAAPNIIKGESHDNEMQRVEAEISQLQRTGTQSKPWAQS